MQFSISREALLKPLQTVGGVVERRQTMAILSNVLINVGKGDIAFTATDMELEISASTSLDVSEPGEITVPARKLIDICRALPEGADVEVKLDNAKQRLTVRSGKSRFSLTTLPATDFPNLADIDALITLTVSQTVLKSLLDSTHFAMAQHDVRFYLNGLLLEISKNSIRTVATDGHRLAYSERYVAIEPKEPLQVILPRKGVLELSKLLEHSEEPVELVIGTNHLRVKMRDHRFTSKLVDGRYPGYQSVIPKDGDRMVTVDRTLLRDALTRTAILSNEKFRGIRLRLSNGVLQASAHNPEREEAEEEIEVDFTGPDLETGFNVNYLLEALNIIPSDKVHMAMGGFSNSCVMSVSVDKGESIYVIMPMKL